MKRFHCSLIAFILLLSTCRSLPAGETQSPPRGAALELLVQAGKQFELWKFDVQVDGKPLDAHWNEVFGKLFDFADVDGNDAIDRIESRLLPSAYGIRQTLWGRFLPTPARITSSDLDRNADDAVSRQELADYYRMQGLGNVIVATGVAPVSDELTGVLADKLGLNNKQPMTRDRWQVAVKSIRRLNKNGDGLIGPGELIGSVRYPGTAATQLLRPSSVATDSKTVHNLPLMLVSADTHRSGWAQAVSGGLNSPDLDRNGTVSAKELQQWRSSLPQLVWRVRYGKPTAAPSDAQRDAVANKEEISRPGLAVQIRIDKRRDDSAVLAPLARFRSQFREVDATGDGYVNDDKLKLHPQLRELRKLLRLADRDRDGRLTSAEMNRWQRLQQAYVRGGVLLSVLDFGKGLFELLDADFDGSLSKTELDTGWDRLSKAGVLDDRSLYSASRLPCQMRVTLSSGLPASQLRMATVTGPAWFAAMDRNKDQRLSRAEFLGGDAAFMKLDANGDGMISPAEASSK